MKGSSSSTSSNCQHGQKKRSKSIDRDRCKDRDLDRNYCDTSPERNRKMSRYKECRSRHKDSHYDQRNKTKSKKSKYTKKSRYHRRNRSSSESSSSSSCSSRCSSRCSHSSRNSKHSNTKMNKVKTENSDSNSHSTTLTTPTTTTTSRINSIDLLDVKIQKALEAIEEDAFAPKVFYSTRNREAPTNSSAKDKVIIDLNTETVTFSKPADMSISDTNDIVIYHPNFLGDAEKKQDKWLRKLFVYRQKCMSE